MPPAGYPLGAGDTYVPSYTRDPTITYLFRVPGGFAAGNAEKRIGGDVLV